MYLYERGAGYLGPHARPLFLYRGTRPLNPKDPNRTRIVLDEIEHAVQKKEKKES